MMGESGQCDADYPAVEGLEKILNMSRVEYFFFREVFRAWNIILEGLNIWKNDKLRKLQEAYVSGSLGRAYGFYSPHLRELQG